MAALPNTELDQMVGQASWPVSTGREAGPTVCSPDIVIGIVKERLQRESSTALQSERDMAEAIDRNAPATKGDLKDLEDRMNGKLKDLEDGMNGNMKALEDRLSANMKALEDRMVEMFRDMETKLLQGFYSFAESNQTRMTAFDTETAAIKSRLATLEERVLRLERKVNFPNPS